MQLYAGWSYHTKASTLTNNTTYLIVSGNSGTAYMLANNNGIGTKQIAINTNGTINTLADSDLEHCQWLYSNSAFKNNNQYLHVKISGNSSNRQYNLRLNSSATKWTCTIVGNGYNMQENNSGRYLVYSNNNFTTSSDASTIYFYYAMPSYIFADQVDA